MQIGEAKIVPSKLLSISKYNARKDDERDDSDDFKELVDSIKINGLLEPIIVRSVLDQGGYEIIAGTRRFRALKAAGAKDIPIVVRNDLDDNDVRILSLIENIHRKSLQENEKLDCLSEIYKQSHKEWVPTHPTNAESLLLEKEGLSGLAKAYLSRLHNEKVNPNLCANSRKVSAIVEDKQIKGKGGGNRGQAKQEVYPTDEFRELANRVGYAYSTQYNILRGYGAFREGNNYLAELSPEIQKLLEEKVEEAIKQDPELKKHERLEQEIAQRLIIKVGKGKAKQNTKARKKQGQTQKKNSKEQKMKKAEQVIDKLIGEQKDSIGTVVKTDDGIAWVKKYPKSDKEHNEKTEINPTVAREQIMILCEKLFKLLTGLELDSDLDIGESQAKSVQAINNMKAVATHYTRTRETAALQYIIIPTSKALSTFRDLVYESVENEKTKDGLEQR